MPFRTSAALRILCALVTLVCLGCDWSSPEAKEAKHRERAISYFEKSQSGKAREQADLVLVSAPHDAEGLILKGRSLINEQHYAEGIKELIRAIIPNLTGTKMDR